MSQVLVATHNAKKLTELRRILVAEISGVEVLGLDDVAPYDEPPEVENTFEGNALIKARAAVAATSMPSLADDSGICVDALNSMPGVLSARWSGTPRDDARNNQLLLAQLADIPDERRHAEFRCAVAFVTPDGDEFIEIGVVRGTILLAGRGSNGFGYDPLFRADGQTYSNAELSADDKDRISHRGRALRDMVPTVAKALRRR